MAYNILVLVIFNGIIREVNVGFLGKKVRMNRLLSKGDGRYFGITIDHAIARGVLKGLDSIADTLAKLVEGGARCHHHA